MAYGLEIRSEVGKVEFSSDSTLAKLHSSYSFLISTSTPLNSTLMSVNFPELLTNYNRLVILPTVFLDSYGFLTYERTPSGFTLKRTGVSMAGFSPYPINISIWVS